MVSRDVAYTDRIISNAFAMQSRSTLGTPVKNNTVSPPHPPLFLEGKKRSMFVRVQVGIPTTKLQPSS